MINDVNGLGGFLNANVGAAVPAPVLEGWVDQLKSGLGFAARHQGGVCLAGLVKRGSVAASKHAAARARPTGPDVVARYWLSPGPSEYGGFDIRRWGHCAWMREKGNRKAAGRARSVELNVEPRALESGFQRSGWACAAV